MKINFNTQIPLELAQELAAYLKEHPGISKAQFTADAIQAALDKEKHKAKKKTAE